MRPTLLNQKGGRRPLITASGIKYQKRGRFAPWVPAVSVPDGRKQRLMLTETLKIGMTVVMSNHVYMFDGKIRYQQLGGSIDLELTGN